MHIDRTHQVPMPGKLAVSARPISSLGLVSMPTYRTAARCSSFGAAEAHDVSSLAFVREIVNVLAILPQSHPLIVVSPIVFVTNAMRIADEEGPNLVLNTEVDNLASRFVSHVANTPLRSTTLFVFGSLQLFPATRILFAAGLLLRDFPELLASEMFERTNAAPGDDHRRSGIGGDSCQMDLAEVYCGLSSAGSLFRLCYLYADMQLEAVIPHEATRTTGFGQINEQNEGRAMLAHRQHHPAMLFGDSLRRPFDWVEAFGAPWVFHLHMGMTLTKLVGRLDVGEEGGDDHLNRLAMQGETPFGGFLQRITTRPWCMGETGRFVCLHTRIPDLRGFHLGSFAVLELSGR
nr:hypothetical protein [Dictyobacter vulcani]